MTEPHQFSSGPLEDLTEPCKKCSKPVTRSVPPSGTTFGDLMRATGVWCDQCTAELDAAEVLREQGDEQRKAQEKRTQALANAGLPAAFASATFDACRKDGMPEHALAAAERWGRGQLRGLVITGPVGVGKSTLAAAAVIARIGVEGRAVHWTSAPALFAALAGNFESATRARALAVLEDGRALALDDIDKGRPTAYGAEMTYLAVDQRIVNRGPLLVTTNSGLDALAGRWPEEYAEAIVSRLVGHCELIAVGGGDRRLAPAVSSEAQAA